MYELYQNTMCVRVAEFLEAIQLKLNTYRTLCDRNWLELKRRGGNGRTALIAFDTMREDLKKKIVAIAGDPYQVHHHQEFIDSINRDMKAFEFYNNEHRFDDGKQLPKDTIDLYVMEASILNSVWEFVNYRRQKAKNKSLTKIWEKVSEMVNSLPQNDPLPHNNFIHKLPNNPRRLQQKAIDYKRDGYVSLIHKNFCNTNSEKINDAAKLWVLGRWADQVNKCATHSQLLIEYNHKAQEHGWQQLKNEETLRIYLDRKDVYNLWYGYRHGELKAKEKFMYQHKTKLPSMRDSLWYSDGTKLNLFYQNEEGKVETINVYEVMDAYSEVFLGYHISKTENYEAQFFAYKMAIQTAEHRPYEIKFDNQGGHKKLEAGSLFSKLARISVRTKPYNGKSKTIESAFGRFQAQYLKQYWFFTGMNIQTKKDESKANLEFINANKNNLPTLDEVIKIYVEARRKWNEATHPLSGLPRIETYRNSHNPETPEVQIWDMVDLFWIERPKPITVDAYGISFKENKVQHDYMVYNEKGEPDAKWLRKHVGTKLYIKYDPQDMEMIYLYEKDSLGLRFLTEAKTKVIIHRATQDQQEGEMAYIHQVNQIEKLVRMEAREEMETILIEQGRHPSQHGLNSPNLKGIESSKSRIKDDYGKVQKQISEQVLQDEEEISIYKQML